MEIMNNYKTWHLSLEEYEKGVIYEKDIYGKVVFDEITKQPIIRETWSNVLNGFKVPLSVIKNFRISNMNSDGDIVNVFDKEKAFFTLTHKYINAIVAEFTILENVEMWRLKDKHKYTLQKVIYQAMLYGISNNQIYEKILNSSLSMSGININDNVVSWGLTSDIFGMEAYTPLYSLHLENYIILDEDELNYIYKENKDTGVLEVVYEWESD